MSDRHAATSARPAVSVIVPFFGDHAEFEALCETLASLALQEGDEAIVADNTPGLDRSPPTGVRCVQAHDHASSYYARNVGAEVARNDWFLFIDADCVPAPGLLDAFFTAEIPAETGAIAGEIEPAGTGLIDRYAMSRGVLSQGRNRSHPFRPAAVTANLLVRREAWHSLGGFQEGVRSGADTEFSWRLQELGWELGYRPRALVAHRHRERLLEFSRQIARHSGGASWLNRRFPGSMRRHPLGRELARSIGGIVVWSARAELDKARFSAIDGLLALASTYGYLSGNGSSRPAGSTEPAGVTVFCDAFAHLSETFVVSEIRALRRLGVPVRVEAISRPLRPARGALRGLRVNFREDDSAWRRIADGLWIVARHPLRSVRDAAAQRGWRAGGDHATRLPSLALAARRAARSRDRHLHAHFATSAALEAMRVSRLLGVPYSVAAHAYEIFARPANLVEKLSAAKFVSTDCDYNVRHLRGLLDGTAAGRVHEVILGIDESRFTRTAPIPGTRVVGAVGRLVEKKGFEHLLDALALLETQGDPVDRLLLAGSGPLRDELEEQAHERGIAHRVEFLGALEPHEVLGLLERIDLFALPCVIAADGDRDSMPVVVKEALAMEVPVVGSDLVGLPEMVRPEWGRLVAPADPAALAEAIADLLSRPRDERARMGAAGRAFVLEHCNVDREAEKVAGLIGGPTRPRGAREGRGEGHLAHR